MSDDNYAGMTDEEFMTQPLPEDEPEEVSQEEEAVVEEEQQEEEVQEEQPTEDETDTEEEPAEDNNTEEDSNTDEEPEPDETQDTEASQEDSKESDVESKEIDYKAEYERLVAPFKASHRQVQVANVDDALNLMRQGVDYTKKMQGLKPNLKLMKMLQNNELLDEEKINYMIDLSKHNPEAVQKYLKESGLDPLDINTEEESNYKPSNYQVTDKEVELDAALDNIRDTPAFQDTINIITKQLDSSSKTVLTEAPQLIETINSHVESGMYQQVMSVVENERMLGRLQGMNDLEAYKHVGDVIQANGGFNQQAPQQPVAQQQPTSQSVQQEKQRTQARKSASPTKGTKAGSQKAQFDPMKMDDDEFMKATNNMFDNYG